MLLSNINVFRYNIGTLHGVLKRTQNSISILNLCVDSFHKSYLILMRLKVLMISWISLTFSVTLEINRLWFNFLLYFQLFRKKQLRHWWLLWVGERYNGSGNAQDHNTSFPGLRYCLENYNTSCSCIMFWNNIPCCVCKKTVYKSQKDRWMCSKRSVNFERYLLWS